MKRIIKRYLIGLFKTIVELSLWGVMLFVFLTLFGRCSTTTKQDTNKYINEVTDLKTEIVDLPPVIQKRIVDTLDKSVELLTEKDSQIESLTEENKTLSVKADKWDKLINTLWFIAISLLIVFLILLLWKYRITILRLCGIPIPPWMT